MFCGGAEDERFPRLGWCVSVSGLVVGDYSFTEIIHPSEYLPLNDLMNADEALIVACGGIIWSVLYPSIIPGIRINTSD